MNEQLAGLRPEHRDVFRLTGVVFFAAGAMALFIRKSSQDQWAAFPKLLVLAIPCVLLYGLGTGDLRIGREDDTPADARAVAAWRAAALVLGLILLPLTLAQLVDTLGGDPNKSGHTFWTFAVTAAAGWYAAFARGLRWGALFAGLAVIISWIALCDALFDPSPTALRWLFIDRRRRPRGGRLSARPRRRARGRRARDRRRRGRLDRGHHRPRGRLRTGRRRAPSPPPSGASPT